MSKTSMFDKIVDSYVKNYLQTSSFDEDEIKTMSDVLKKEILEEAVCLISEDDKKKIKKETKGYKRRQLQKLKLSLIVETIFLAFCIGIIVNQVTNLIPVTYAWYVIIIFLLISVLIVIVATVTPKE